MYNRSKENVLKNQRQSNSIQRKPKVISSKQKVQEKRIVQSKIPSGKKILPPSAKEKPKILEKKPIQTVSTKYGTKTSTSFKRQSIPPPKMKPIAPKLSVSNRGLKKRGKYQHKDGITWATLPCNNLISICQYAYSNIHEVYQLSRVCSIWRAQMCSDMGQCFWNWIPGAEQIISFYQLKNRLQKYIVQQQQKMSFQYQKSFTKLFNYGSTKQNIPNKLIQKLDLEIQIKLNKNPVKKHPFKLRIFNFSSYLCMKIQQIKQYKYDFTTPHNLFKDNITLELNFRSKKFRVSHKVSKKYCPEEVCQMAIKQKAFNYYLDKNFVFTYFEGDNHFLYIFYEISVLELVNIFRGIIKQKHQENISKKSKKLPMYKQLCETQFENFSQYMKFQADFQIHFSYHNSLKQIFTHCDTKVYPIQVHAKQALFQVKVDDSFDKVDTYKLDNKMGISEGIKDLYLLDFVLKDRDRFLIIFSGFIYARNATQKERQSLQDYFIFAQNEIKVIQYKKQKEYDINFIIIQENKRNFMKKVTFRMFSSMISLR